MKNTPYFCYREATNMTELEPLLRLRYQVFKEEESTKALFPDNELGMEIDYFDLKSRHFGIYLVMNGQSIPVGYQRIIHETETSIASNLRLWASRYPSLLRKITPVNTPLYLMTVNNSKAMWDYYLDKKANGATFEEASRTSFLSAYRSYELTKFIFYANMAIGFFDDGCNTGITSCTSKLSVIHSRLGLRKIEHCDYTFENMAFCVMEITKADFQFQQCSYLENMAEAFQATGSICLHQEQPHYYYPPAWFAFAGLSSRTFLPAMLRAAHVHRPMAMAS